MLGSERRVVKKSIRSGSIRSTTEKTATVEKATRCRPRSVSLLVQEEETIKKKRRRQTSVSNSVATSIEEEFPNVPFELFRELQFQFTQEDHSKRKSKEEEMNKAISTAHQETFTEKNEFANQELQDLFSSNSADQYVANDKTSKQNKSIPFRKPHNVKKLTIPNESTPRIMPYFEPVADNCQGSDELQLYNAPLISEQTDDIRVCRYMYQAYPNGVHGYSKDKYDISNQLLFDMMCKLLPSTDNPDLLYYTLYLTFPNTGTQEEFSNIFPKLVDKFVQDPAENKKLKKLERWKKVGNSNDTNNKTSVKYEHPCSFRNYFLKSIKLPSKNEENMCSENCYKLIWGKGLRRLMEENELTCDDGADYLEIFVDKSCSDECDFLNKVFLADEKPYIKDFCAVAENFPEKTCSGWFRTLLSVSEQPSASTIESASFPVPHKKRMGAFQRTMDVMRKILEKNRDLELQKQAAEEGEDIAILRKRVKCESVLETVFPLEPCCHVGPCGKSNPDCSCDLFCSVYCQCDVNCTQKFPGCRCQEGKCSSTSCPCRKLGWECIDGLCQTCLNNEDRSCQNNAITLQKFKSIKIAESLIPGAGNGAFIEEDAERGEFIGEYVGEHISEDESERRGKFYELRSSYLFNLTKRGSGSIDAGRAGNTLRFVNEDKKPNCKIKLRMASGQLSLGFYADRRIQAGSELTLNYNYDAVKAEKFFKVAPEDRCPRIPKEKPKAYTTKYKKDPSEEYNEVYIPPQITSSGRAVRPSIMFGSQQSSNTSLRIDNLESTSTATTKDFFNFTL